MTPPLIGLLGKKRSGKNTFAEALVTDFGYAPLAFADPLRDLAARINPIVSWDYISDDPVRYLDAMTDGYEVAKDTYPAVREFLVGLGQGIRADDPLYWVTRLEERALALTRKSETPIVVTDVRLPNEADWIEDMGGLLVRIVRPGYPAEGEVENITETALDDREVDLTIHNNFTPEVLRAMAHELGRQIESIGVNHLIRTM